MPNVGSWNGKWTGTQKVYYRTKSFLNKNAPTVLLERLKEKSPANYYYNFGDGWGANILVELIDSNEARKRNKISSGFCGYEWMIDSIIKNDKIIVE
jgi:hypothetical protein